MNVIHILIVILIALLILLLGGARSLGWTVVGVITFVLLMIPNSILIIKRMNKKQIKDLEKTIRKKEALGYGDEELNNLKTQLKYFKRD